MVLIKINKDIEYLELLWRITNIVVLTLLYKMVIFLDFFVVISWEGSCLIFMEPSRNHYKFYSHDSFDFAIWLRDMASYSGGY